MTRLLVRFISAVLALVMTTQTAFAHLPEKNIWEERRAALITPSNLPVSPLLSGSLLPSAKTSPTTKIDSRLSKFVRIQKDTVKNQKTPAYLIQDIHLNEEAQRNMAGALNVLLGLDKNRPEVIGVEGSTGRFDFVPYRNHPRTDVVKKIADQLLQEGRVGAAGYLGITSQASGFNQAVIVGVETPALYSDNVNAYRAAMEQKDAISKQIEAAARQLEARAQKDLKTSVLKIYQAREDYARGRIGLGDYAVQLSMLAPSAEMPLHLQTFISAFGLEKKIDFARADRERKYVLERLVRTLNKTELQKLADQTELYRQRSVVLADYYVFLKKLITSHGIDLKTVPAFDEYLRYVLLSDGIQVERVIADLKTLEENAVASLKPGAPEKEILNEAQRLILTRKLTEFALTPEEWGEYQSRHSGESRNPGLKQSFNVRSTDWTPAFAGVTTLRSFEDFYRLADLRSQAMVENLLKARTSKGPIAVVTGGFHAPEMQKILAKKGFAPVVLTPNITKIETVGGTEYLQVFLREKSPLQKLFAGRKLFLGLPEGAGLEKTPQPEAPLLRQRVYRFFEMQYNLLAGDAGYLSMMFGHRLDVLPAILSWFAAKVASGVMLAMAPLGGGAEFDPMKAALTNYQNARAAMWDALERHSFADFTTARADLIRHAATIRRLVEEGADAQDYSLEIQRMAGRDEDLGPAARQAIQEEFNLLRDAFPEAEREDVEKLFADVLVVGINPEVLLPLGVFSGLAEDGDWEGAQDLLAAQFQRASRELPEHASVRGRHQLIVLSPRKNIDHSALIAIHELGHALQRLKALESPAASEIFTEAITMLITARKSTRENGLEHLRALGKPEADDIFVAAEKWAKEHPAADEEGIKGFDEICKEVSKTILADDRNVGLFIGAVLFHRDPENALKNLVLYAHSTLAEIYEDHREPIIDKAESVLEKLHEQIVEVARTESQILNLQVKPWSPAGNNNADRPRWRFTTQSPGSSTPAQLEFPPMVLWHKDEELTVLEAAIQGRSLFETQGIIQDGDLKYDIGFQLLFGAAFNLRSEQWLKAERVQLPFDRRERNFYPNLNNPAAKRRFDKLPFYVQYIEAMLSETRRGKRDPRATSKELREVMEKTAGVWKTLLSPTALESEAIQALQSQGAVNPTAQKIQAQRARLLYELIKTELWPLLKDKAKEAEEVFRHENQKDAERLAQQMGAAGQGAQGEIRRVANLGDILKAIAQLGGDAEGAGKDSADLKGLSGAAGTQAKKITSDAGTGKHNPGDGELLLQLAKQISAKARELGDKTRGMKTTTGGIKNKAKGTNKAGEPASDSDAKAGNLDKIAGKIVASADALADAADGLNKNLNKENNGDITGIQATATEADKQSDEVGKEADKIDKGLQALAEALGELKDAVEGELENPGPDAPEGEPQDGDDAGDSSDSSDSSTPSGSGGQVSDKPVTPDIDEDALRHQLLLEQAANEGFTWEEYDWFHNKFLGPVKPVISTLSEEFIKIVDQELLSQLGDPSEEGEIFDGDEAYRAYTDRKVYVSEEDPEAIQLNMMFLIDASGSMGDMNDPYSKFFQTAQAISALAMALIKVQKERGLLIKINLEIRGYSERDYIPLFSFTKDFTPRKLYLAIRELMAVDDRRGTEDLGAMKLGSETVLSEPGINGRTGYAVVNATDGNYPEMRELIRKEVYDPIENRKINYLTIGVGDGAKMVMEVYFTEDHENVAVVPVPKLAELGRVIMRLGFPLFRRLVQMAKSPTGLSILLFISCVIIDCIFGTVSSGFAASIPPLLGLSEQKTRYKIEERNGILYLVLFDKDGDKISYPIRQDTSKIPLKTPEGVEWKVEHWKVEAKNSEGEVCTGMWINQEWQWYIDHKRIENPPSWMNVEVGNNTFEVKSGEDTVFHGTLPSQSLRPGETPLWQWIFDPKYKNGEEELGSFIPKIEAVMKDGTTKDIFEAVGDPNATPDKLILTVGGKSRRIKLDDTFTHELAEVMMFISQPEVAATNCLMAGHKSTGKDTAVYVLAALLKQPVQVQNIHADTTESELSQRTTMGNREAGTTDETMSPFFLAAHLGHWIVSDEITKMKKLENVVVLQSVLEEREDQLDDGTKVIAKDSFRAFFLYNPPGGIYGGNSLNRVSAFKSRNNLVIFEYPTWQEEKARLWDSIFSDVPDDQKEEYEKLTEAITKVGAELRVLADSALGKQKKIPPADSRQMARTLKHIRMFPDDKEYIRDIFLQDYSLTSVAGEHREYLKTKVEEAFDRQFASDPNKYDKRFFDAADDLNVKIEWPVIDLERNVVIFKAEGAASVEVPLGTLGPVTQPDPTYFDLPYNRWVFWMMAKDIQLNNHNGIMGLKGTGKSSIIRFFFKNILHQEVEKPSQMSPKAKGQKMLGAGRLKSAKTIFPATALKRSMQKGVRLFIGEAGEAPGAMSALNNVLEYGVAMMTSGEEVVAQDGWGVTVDGNLPEAHNLSQNFSAEFSSRFRLYLSRPLSKKDRIKMMENMEAKNRPKIEARGETWTPLSEDTKSALADAFAQLNEAHRNSDFEVPVDDRAIRTMVLLLGRFPRKSLEVKKWFLQAMSDDGSDEDQTRGMERALWALAPIWLRGQMDQLLQKDADIQKLPNPEAYGNAVVKVLCELARQSKDANPLNKVKFTIGGVEYEEAPFDHSPTTEELVKVAKGLPKLLENLVTVEKTAATLANLLGIDPNDKEMNRLVQGAVEATGFHMAVNEEARKAALKELTEQLADNIEKKKLDQRLHAPLLALAPLIVDAIGAGLKEPPTVEKVAALVDLLANENIEATAAKRVDTTTKTLGLADKTKMKTMLETSGLGSAVVAVAADIKRAREAAEAKQPGKGQLMKLLDKLEGMIQQRPPAPVSVPALKKDLTIGDFAALAKAGIKLEDIDQTAISPDGRFLAVAYTTVGIPSDESKVQLIDRISKDSVGDYEDLPEPARFLSFFGSKDDQLAVITKENDLKVFLASDSGLQKIYEGEISPDTKAIALTMEKYLDHTKAEFQNLIATLGSDNQIKVTYLDGIESTQYRPPCENPAELYSKAFRDESDRVSDPDAVRKQTLVLPSLGPAMDLREGDREALANAGIALESVDATAISPVGQFLAVVITQKGSSDVAHFIQVFNRNTKDKIGTPQLLPFPARSISFFGVENLMVGVLCENNTLALVKVTDTEVERIFSNEIPSGSKAVAVSPDLTEVAIFRSVEPAGEEALILSVLDGSPRSDGTFLGYDPGSLYAVSFEAAMAEDESRKRTFVFSEKETEEDEDSSEEPSLADEILARLRDKLPDLAPKPEKPAEKKPWGWDKLAAGDIADVEAHTDMDMLTAVLKTDKYSFEAIKSQRGPAFVIVRDGTNSRLLIVPHADMNIRSLAVSEDQSTLFAVLDDESAVAWNVALGKSLVKSPVSGPVVAVAQGPDEQSVAFLRSNGFVYAQVNEVSSMDSQREAFPPKMLFAKAFPRARADAAESARKTILLEPSETWGIETLNKDELELLKKFSAGFEKVTAVIATKKRVIFAGNEGGSPDFGSIIIVVEKDKPDIKEVLHFEGHQLDIRRLAVDAEETTLISIQEDESAVVWDLATQQPAVKEPTKAHPIVAVARYKSTSMIAVLEADITMAYGDAYYIYPDGRIEYFEMNGDLAMFYAVAFPHANADMAESARHTILIPSLNPPTHEAVTAVASEDPIEDIREILEAVGETLVAAPEGEEAAAAGILQRFFGAIRGFFAEVGNRIQSVIEEPMWGHNLPLLNKENINSTTAYDVLYRFGMEGRDVKCVAESPDGKWLAIGTAKDESKAGRSDLPYQTGIYLVNRQTFVVEPLPGNAADVVLSIAFKDNNTIAAGYANQGIQFWQRDNTGFMWVSADPIEGDTPLFVKYLPDGRLVSVTDQFLYVYDQNNIQINSMGMPFGAKATSFTVSSDGHTVAWVGDNHKAYMVDVNNIGIPTPIGENIYAVCISPDRNTVTTTGERGDLYFWDVANGTEKVADRVKLDSNRNFLGMHYSNDGTLLLTQDDAGNIRTWDVKTKQEVNDKNKPLVTGTNSLPFILSPDGKRMLTVTMGTQVREWFIKSDATPVPPKDQVLTPFGLAQPAESFAVHPKNGIVATVHQTEGGSILVMKGVAFLGETDDKITVVEFSPDGRFLAIGYDHGLVRLYEFSESGWNQLDSMRQSEIDGTNGSAVTAITFRADMSRLVVGHEDNGVVIWDTSTIDVAGSTVSQLFDFDAGASVKYLRSDDWLHIGLDRTRIAFEWKALDKKDISNKVDSNFAAIDLPVFGSPEGEIRNFGEIFNTGQGRLQDLALSSVKTFLATIDQNTLRIWKKSTKSKPNPTLHVQFGGNLKSVKAAPHGAFYVLTEDGQLLHLQPPYPTGEHTQELNPADTNVLSGAGHAPDFETLVKTIQGPSSEKLDFIQDDLKRFHAVKILEAVVSSDRKHLVISAEILEKSDSTTPSYRLLAYDLVRNLPVDETNSSIEPCGSLRFDPSGYRVAFRQGNNVREFSFNEGNEGVELIRPANGPRSVLAWSKKNVIAIPLNETDLSLVDPMGRVLKDQFVSLDPLGTESITSVAFSEDGNLLAVGTNKQTIQIWNVQHPANPTLLVNRTVDNGSPITMLQFDAKGRLLVADQQTPQKISTIHLYSINGDKLVNASGSKFFHFLGDTTSVDFPADGAALAVAREPKSASDKIGLKLQDLSQPSEPVYVQMPPVPLAFWDAANNTFVTLSKNGQIEKWKFSSAGSAADLPDTSGKGKTSEALQEKLARHLLTWFEKAGFKWEVVVKSVTNVITKKGTVPDFETLVKTIQRSPTEELDFIQEDLKRFHAVEIIKQVVSRDRKRLAISAKIHEKSDSPRPVFVVIIYDLVDKKPIVESPVYSMPVTNLEFDPTGQHLVFRIDGDITRFSIGVGIEKILDVKGNRNVLAWSKRGVIVVPKGQTFLQLIDQAGHVLKNQIHSQDDSGRAMDPTAAAFNDEGDLLAVGNNAGGVQVWNMANPNDPQPVAKLRVVEGATILGLKFSSDGRLAVAVQIKTKQTFVFLLKIHGSTLVQVDGNTGFSFAADFTSLEFVAGNAALAVTMKPAATSTEKPLLIQNLSKPTEVIGVDTTPLSLVSWDAEKNTFVELSNNGKIATWEFGEPAAPIKVEPEELPSDDWIRKVLLGQGVAGNIVMATPMDKGQYMAVVMDTNLEVVHILDVSGKYVRQDDIEGASFPVGFERTPREDVLVVSGSSELKRLQGGGRSSGTSHAQVAAMSSTGLLVVSDGAEMIVDPFNILGMQAAINSTDGKHITALAWSIDSRLRRSGVLAVAKEDSIQLIDFTKTTRRYLDPIKAPKDVYLMQFSKSGHLAVAAGGGGVHLTKAMGRGNRKTFSPLPLPPGVTVRSFRFIENDEILVAATDIGLVAWDVKNRECIATFGPKEMGHLLGDILSVGGNGAITVLFRDGTLRSWKIPKPAPAGAVKTNGLMFAFLATPTSFWDAVIRIAVLVVIVLVFNYLNRNYKPAETVVNDGPEAEPLGLGALGEVAYVQNQGPRTPSLNCNVVEITSIRDLEKIQFQKLNRRDATIVVARNASLAKAAHRQFGATPVPHVVLVADNAQETLNLAEIISEGLRSTNPSFDAVRMAVKSKNVQVRLYAQSALWTGSDQDLIEVGRTQVPIKSLSLQIRLGKMLLQFLGGLRQETLTQFFQRLSSVRRKTLSAA